MNKDERTIVEERIRRWLKYYQLRIYVPLGLVLVSVLACAFFFRFDLALFVGIVGAAYLFSASLTEWMVGKIAELYLVYAELEDCNEIPEFVKNVLVSLSIRRRGRK